MKKFSIFNFKFSKKETGFTLIELIVSIFIFSLIAIGVAQIFISAVRIQASTFSAQTVVENSLNVLEPMARDIRVSKICVSGSNCSTNRLDLVHPVKGTVSYSLDTARGVVQKTEAGSTVDITPTDVNFTRFNFLTSGFGIDNRQPKVTMVVSVQNTSGRVIRFDLQTTVTSRDATEELQN